MVCVFCCMLYVECDVLCVLCSVYMLCVMLYCEEESEAVSEGVGGVGERQETHT